MTAARRTSRSLLGLVLPVVGSVIIGMWAGAVLRDFACCAVTADVGLDHYRAVPFQGKLRAVARLSETAAIISGGAVTGLLAVVLAGLASSWQRNRMTRWLTLSLVGWLPLLALVFLRHLEGGLGDMGVRRLAVGVAGGAFVGSWGLQLWLTVRSTLWARLVTAGRWGGLAICCFCMLLPLALWASLVQWPTGDEPHYLLVMRSLVADGDLDIRNNHERGEYSLFYEQEIAHAHAIAGTRGRWFSKHSPGLPVLAVPFYAAGGRWGVVVLMTALASWLVVSLHRLMVDADVGADRVACLGWWITFSIPLLAYANQAFPAVPAGLAVAEGCRLWLRSDASDRRTMAVLVGLALVGWLHLASLQIAGPLLLVLWLRAGARRRRLLRLAVAPGFVLLLVLLYYWSTLGRLLPALGAYGSYDLLQIPEVLPRLLTDQEHGLLIHAPFWVGAVWGLGRAARNCRWTVPMVLGAAYVLMVASWNWWYGGWAPVGRFLLPVLPLALVPLAVARRGVGLGERLLGGWAVTVGFALTAYPAWRYNANDGSAALLDSIESVVSWDLHSAFPSGTSLGLALAGVYLGGFLWASRASKPWSVSHE